MLSFLLPKENCITITKEILSQLGVQVTFTSLKNDLYNHPDYPSLLSVSDVLAKYGVENLSIKTTLEQLYKIPLPCIVPIKEDNNKDQFTVITEINADGVKYYHPVTHKWTHVPLSKFEKIWPSGLVFLAEAEGAKGEKYYQKKRREEKRSNIIQYTTWLALPLLAISTMLLTFVNYGLSAGLPILLMLLFLLGSAFGGLLLWYELDEYNPVLQQICSAGKKTNCGAILNSKASKIAGISWSTIGFTYFVGGLFTLLALGITNPTALFILAWLNTLAIPYVFFSIYYQWHIAKQWCVLCLSVQALLVLQFITALTAGWHSIVPIAAALSISNLIPIILSFAMPFLSISLLMPAYRAAKESKRIKTELLRLKHNPQIFEALLEKKKLITESSAGLGIIIGNPNAKHTLIKVCGPYCGPCANAHPVIEDLLENNPDVKLQIIFNAYDHGHDMNAYPAKHLLAIFEKQDEAVTKKALNDWYLADDKNYETFAAKYPMNGELSHQLGKITAMRQWCDKTEISFTPTFFLNGRQLPEVYNVADLKYFLAV